MAAKRICAGFSYLVQVGVRRSVVEYFDAPDIPSAMPTIIARLCDFVLAYRDAQLTWVSDPDKLFI